MFPLSGARSGVSGDHSPWGGDAHQWVSGLPSLQQQPFYRSHIQSAAQLQTLFLSVALCIAHYSLYLYHCLSLSPSSHVKTTPVYFLSPGAYPASPLAEAGVGGNSICDVSIPMPN